MTYWVSDTIAEAALRVRVTPDELVGTGRSTGAVHGRHMVALALREKRQMTHAEIARRLGGRHPSTILDGIRRARGLRMTSEAFAEAYADVAATVPILEERHDR